MLFLLDTNIISEPLRSRPNRSPGVEWQNFAYRLPIESNKRQIIEVYLQREIKQKIPIIPYDIAAAEWFAREQARLTAIGKTPAYADGQIAAIAQVNNLTLVTNNVADYSNFQNLKIENWLDL